MIYVDDRIGSKQLAPLLEKLGLPVEVSRLEYGDVSFLGRGPEGAPITVGIELKNIMDLANSMTTGRLSGHQLPGLVQQYQQVWLLVEGVYRISRRDGSLELPRGPKWGPLRLGRRIVFAREIQSYLTTLEVCGGLRVRTSRTPYESARFIEGLYRWWTEKAYEEHRSHLHVGAVDQPIIGFMEPSLKQKFAATLPGVGWERSKAIDLAFDTVQEMVNADEKEWLRVPGVGRVLAKRIVKVLQQGEGG